MELSSSANMNIESDAKPTLNGTKRLESTPIRQPIDTLWQLSPQALRDQYEQLFGEPPRCGHRVGLTRRIAWRMQASAEGDLSERARRRASEIADDAALRLHPPRTFQPVSVGHPGRKRHPSRDARLPPPGTLLTRCYQNKTITVQVLENAFEYEGQQFRSLSGIAEKVTGTRWNGFLFFARSLKGPQGD
jgi:hypothetical protein